MIKRYLWLFLFFAALGFVSTFILLVAIYNVLIVPTMTDKMVDVAVVLLVGLCVWYCLKKSFDFLRKMREPYQGPEEIDDSEEFAE